MERKQSRIDSFLEQLQCHCLDDQEQVLFFIGKGEGLMAQQVNNCSCLGNNCQCFGNNCSCSIITDNCACSENNCSCKGNNCFCEGSTGPDTNIKIVCY